MLEAKGDLEGARETYQQILQKESTNENARKGLAAVLIKAQLKDPFSDESDELTSHMKNKTPALSK